MARTGLAHLKLHSAAALLGALLGALGCADRPTAPTVRQGTDEPRLGLLPPGSWQATLIPSLGGFAMRGLAINDSGHVAGWGINGANKTVAFRWKPGTLITIGFPLLYTSARARAINNAGRIVGDITLLSGQRKGFTSVPGALASLLPVWANSANGDHIPFGVNDGDIVVGDSPGLIPVKWTLTDDGWIIEPSSVFNSHYDAISPTSMIAGTEVVPAEAFRTDAPDGWPVQGLGTLGPNPIETFATDINASDHVVGIATREGVPPTYFLWTPGGGMTDVGVQAITPVGLDEHIGALSDAGRIVGVNGATLQPFTIRHGTLHTLPLPLGAVLGFAEDVNTCGVIVGWVMYNDWSTRAVIWRRYNGHQLICDA